MKKYILGLLTTVSLYGMELRVKVKPETNFDLWEFFSEPNHLDKMVPVAAMWNKKCGYSVETAAHLNMLKRSKLNIEKLRILDVGCATGHTSEFLAQQAEWVTACEKDKDKFDYAKHQHPLKNIEFCNSGLSWRTYDLIVSCHPEPDLQLFEILHDNLMPRGEMFCTFTTCSNRTPLPVQILQEFIPTMQKYSYRHYYKPSFEALLQERKANCFITDARIKKMISALDFETKTYEKVAFDILIGDKQHFLDIQKSSAIDLMKKCKPYTNSSRKLVKNLMRIIIQKLKKDALGNWYYPFDFTVVHIKKRN